MWVKGSLLKILVPKRLKYIKIKITFTIILIYYQYKILQMSTFFLFNELVQVDLSIYEDLC